NGASFFLNFKVRLCREGLCRPGKEMLTTTPLTRGYAMPARTVTAPKSAQKVQRELEDLQLVLRARNGSTEALDGLMRKYAGFVRLKASSYFLAGGDGDDLVQEGMIGLYKAMRDFRPDKETSFRSFAELCVTRQIITAIKTATRFKHAPLNTYVSFSHTPAGQESEGDCTLGDALPGPMVNDPSVCVISTEELQSLVFCLGSGLSQLESEALRLYIEGNSYEQMAEDLDCDTKTIDNALQRVKRKILAHQKTREVLS
ncbi:MAG: RNA polymerase sporulation sigma factor SigH, partial [Gaiellaceae bacterium]